MRDTSIRSLEFEFRLDREGNIAFTLGNVRLALPIDAAYELQYQLAEMLAFVETFEDLECAAECLPDVSVPNVIPFEKNRRKNHESP